MNYRPKYIAVGAFAPGRIARLWKPEEADKQPPAIAAMENEGGPLKAEAVPAPRRRAAK